MSSRPVELSCLSIDPSSDDSIACLRLTRESSANSFNAEMMLGIIDALKILSEKSGVRALILMGEGKHFSAGADLSWMKDSSKLNFEENLQDAGLLTNMFELLYNLPVPTIALVQGAAFGGAVGLAACCDVVLADENAKFCLSEVKLGLLPAVIYPYLAKRIRLGPLRRLSLTARVFQGIEALEVGLVDRVFNPNTRDQVLREELSLILTNGPEAIKALKSLHRDLEREGFQQSERTAHAIANARTSAEGQKGLAAFFAKAQAPWCKNLDEHWKLP